MARLIKETPILYGEDAKKFESRMKRKRTEKPEARERRLRDYEDCMAMLEAGKNIRMATRSV
ncbi:MAG: hypothetical protein LUC37_04990 [Prevotella sp.]|nr:hypothetical protein [Prevotella sp.]